MAEAGRIKPLLLFTLFFGILVLFWRPGMMGLQDEAAQAAGLWSLHDGHYYLADLPLPYGTGPYQHFSIPHHPGEIKTFVGSTPLNLLALPLYSVLDLMHPSGHVWPSLVLVQAVVAGLGAYALCRLVPRWQEAAIVAAECVGLGVLIVDFALHADVPTHPFLELATLQLVNMASGAGSALLVFKLLDGKHGRQTAWTGAFLLLLATPAFHWFLAAKYTGLTILLTTAVLYSYRDGYRSSPRRTALAALFAGLAIWNLPPFGLVLALGLVVMALPAYRLGAHAALQRWGAGALMALVGLLPLVAVAMYQTKHGLDDAFLPTGGWSRISDLLSPANPGSWFSHSILADPVGVAKASFWTVVWNSGAKGPALSVLSCAPWLACLVAWRMKSVARQWCLVLTGLLLALTGTLQYNAGDVPDMRYASMLWPALVVLVAPAIPTTIWPLAAKVAVVVAAVLSSFLLVGHAVAGRFLFGDVYHEVSFLFRWASIPLLLAVLWASWKRPQVLQGVVGVVVGFSIAYLWLVEFSTGRYEQPAWSNEPIPAAMVFGPFELVHRFVTNAVYRW